MSVQQCRDINSVLYNLEESFFSVHHTVNVCLSNGSKSTVVSPPET